MSNFKRGYEINFTKARLTEIGNEWHDLVHKMFLFASINMFTYVPGAQTQGSRFEIVA